MDNDTPKDRWQGLSAEAREALQTRDYSAPSLAEALATCGVPAGKLLERDGLEAAWIPGVEVFSRAIYQQNHRGFFGEFARQGEGTVGRIGLWPKQWATARMVAPSAKGFHIHPPHIPEGESPDAWFRRLFIDEPENFALRPYDREQWDVMFFIQGMAEMLLVDERAGMDRKIMRFMIHGDDMPGASNVGVVIPSGVAHAIRTASSNDLIMVYGTSTVFDPAAEGRIAAGVEAAPLPDEWLGYLG